MSKERYGFKTLNEAIGYIDSIKAGMFSKYMQTFKTNYNNHWVMTIKKVPTKEFPWTVTEEYVR